MMMILEDRYQTVKVLGQDTLLEIRLLIQRLENISKSMAQIRDNLIDDKSKEIDSLKAERKADSLQLSQLQEKVRTLTTDNQSNNYDDIDDLFPSISPNSIVKAS